MKNEWISLKAFGAFAEISRAIVRIVTLTMLCLTSIVIQIFWASRQVLFPTAQSRTVGTVSELCKLGRCNVEKLNDFSSITNAASQGMK